MWFQTLKTRHLVRGFSTDNNQGLVTGLEYTDKKAEVHALKVCIYILALNMVALNLVLDYKAYICFEVFGKEFILTFSVVTPHKFREKYPLCCWRKE